MDEVQPIWSCEVGFPFAVFLVPSKQKMRQRGKQKGSMIGKSERENSKEFSSLEKKMRFGLIFDS